MVCFVIWVKLVRVVIQVYLGCYGGLLKIWVCSDCNNERGHSGNIPCSSLGSIATKKCSKAQYTRDEKQTHTWLRLNGLPIYNTIR